MLIIFWIIMIIVLFVSIFGKKHLSDRDLFFLKVINGFIILILLIVTIFCIDGVARDRTIPDKIALYQEQNEVTRKNVNYWLEERHASEDNEIVQMHQNIIKENNERIAKLKEEQIINKKYKWLLYFGE